MNLITVLFLHAAGAGFWEQVLAIIGTIVFMVLLIHMFFYEGRQNEPLQGKKTTIDEEDQDR